MTISNFDTYKEIVENMLKYPKTLKIACEYWRYYERGK